MKKLTLDLDALEIDSFATDARERPRGTAVGAENTFYASCEVTCPISCDGSCIGPTCLQSCAGCEPLYVTQPGFASTPGNQDNYCLFCL